MSVEIQDPQRQVGNERAARGLARSPYWFDHTDSRLDRMDSRIERTDSRIDRTDSRLNNIDSRLNNMDSRLLRMDSHIDRLDDRESRAGVDLAEVIMRLDRLERTQRRHNDMLELLIRVYLQ